MKLLVIDDEPLVRRALQRAFEASGHQVLLAEEGQAGLKMWLDSSPDVVLLDMLMPVMSGPEVLAQIGANKKCPVVLISAFSGQYDHKKAQQLGADHFLAKPFENIFEVVKFVEGIVK